MRNDFAEMLLGGQIILANLQQIVGCLLLKRNSPADAGVEEHIVADAAPVRQPSREALMRFGGMPRSVVTSQQGRCGRSIISREAGPSLMEGKQCAAHKTPARATAT